MQTRQPNLEGAGEIPLRRLVKEALRMRPSRIVVGEVRQEECLDLSHFGSTHTGYSRSNGDMRTQQSLRQSASTDAGVSFSGPHA
jgi:Flp pilus assembly CpaF family ATPase